MGADMFLTLDRWKNPKIIFEKSSIITIPRDDGNKSELEKFYKNVLKPMGADAVILPNPVISVSSTFIRDNLDEFDLISGMLDKSVYDYIIKRKKTRVLTGTMTKKTTKRMNRKIKTVMLLSER